jgi:hypothetical protein
MRDETRRVRGIGFKAQTVFIYFTPHIIQAYVHTPLSFLSFFLVYSVTCACLFIVDGRKITLDEKTGGIILSRLAFPFCKHTCIHTQTMYSRSSLVSSSLLNLLCLDSSSFLITLHFLSSSSGSASPGFRYRWWHPNPTANVFPRAVSTVSDSRPFWQRLLTALIFFFIVETPLIFSSSQNDATL